MRRKSMAEWKNEAEAREAIKDAVAEYCRLYKSAPGAFTPGDRINYAGRVFDEDEMRSLTDATLDFWLTSGRFTELTILPF